MDIRIIERLFLRFEQKGFDTKNLSKSEWCNELSDLENKLELIKFGLNNLKGELPEPRMFRKMCSPLYTDKQMVYEDSKQWARNILNKANDGIKVNRICIQYAKEALRIKDEVR